MIVIAGGGIVGLTTARELLARNLGPVRVLEKESAIARHQTGRNSGVIHSGVYYPPKSEKAAGCLQGIPLLEAFCARNEIPIKRVGKVIVASDESELPTLERLFSQGKEHGIADIAWTERVSDVEPAVSGIAAIHLPHVALVDYRAVCDALRKEIVKEGGEVITSRKVLSVKTSPSEITVETDTGSYAGTHFINCGGLHSDRIAESCGARPNVKIVPFRGEYFTLADRVARTIRGLVYPVPDPRYPFLGVHLTPTLDGRVTAGPNAILALAREGYAWRDINVRDVADYLLYPGFWKMAAAHWRTGLFEFNRSIMKSLYVASVRKFLPAISARDLLAGSSGVRAQAVDRNGKLIHDFLYAQGERSTHILNAPSPAATASFAIARRIAELVPQR